jgi:hypothetical protein
MKKILKFVSVALLTAAMACSTFAGGPKGYYPQGQQHGYHGRSYDSGWTVPLLFLGIAGAVIGAAASQQSAPPPPQQPVYIVPPFTYVQPAPVYVSPPVTMPAPAPQPANAWYFCRSVGQYYPYTQNCPEGWQLISPTPQQ